jgi:transcriptional regulator with XRE-family HTH domain
MAANHQPFIDLDSRRRKLGMSMAVLAARSGVSLPTVQRILSGTHETASFSNVVAIAKVLGVSVKFRERIPLEKLRKRPARQKAKRLVGMVQATAGLEGQAVDANTVHHMVRRTARELLAGSKRRLWSES